MKFEFDLENVILQDRLILLEITEIVERQIKMLSETTQEELSWDLSNLIQLCKRLDVCWLVKREDAIGKAINEQYFESAEELDEKESS